MFEWDKLQNKLLVCLFVGNAFCILYNIFDIAAFYIVVLVLCVIGTRVDNHKLFRFLTGSGLL